MKKLISRSSLIELAPYEFALNVQNINFTRKNEFVSGAVGELPFTDVWPELWLINESDFDNANRICQQVTLEVSQHSADWYCKECKELNASSFEFCWSCGTWDKI